MAAIDVRGLTKRFDDRLVVDDAWFDVPSGAVTGFVGGNGSGKTTTMRMILGLTIPDAGEALVDGVRYGDLTSPRSVIGCVLDRVGAHPGVTGRQHLSMVVAGGRIDRNRVSTVLERVGLTDAADRKIATYSTGMRQRLSLGVALLGDPSTLLLDEPARGLDPAGIRWLRQLLRERADQGGAVLVSTHQLAELSAIVDRVVLIDDGRILAAEPAAELVARTGAADLEGAVVALTDPLHETAGAHR